MGFKIQHILSSFDLENLGAPVTPKELARRLGLTRNTIVKYAHLWGGVEVIPGYMRFFENRIREVLNAKFDSQAWETTLSGIRNGQRISKIETVSKRQQKIISRRNRMGTQGAGTGRIPIDRHGVFDGDNLDQ